MGEKINAYKGLRDMLMKETTLKKETDSAKGQAVSRRLLTAKNRIKSRSIQRGKCGGQIGSETGFASNTSLSPVLPYQCYILINLLKPTGHVMH